MPLESPAGLIALLVLAVLATSILSGVMGMGGGMILMGVLGMALQVPQAMVLHGVTQLMANGSRAFFLRKGIAWRVLGTYCLGATVSFLILRGIHFVPGKDTMFILLGILPFTAGLIPSRLFVDPEQKGSSFICGALVSGCNLIAGVSGPLLDVFFLRSEMSRQEVVATKAATQTIAHSMKLAYYVPVLLEGGELVPIWTYPTVILVAFAGTWVGKHLLERITEEQFRRWTYTLVRIIGAVYLARGVAYHLRAG